MAIYRAVRTEFWSDSRVSEDFTKDDRLFMLYALTSPHSKLCGCYEVSLTQICQETGLSRSELDEVIDRLQNTYRMIVYDKSTRELFIRNWYKYNIENQQSPKLFVGIRKEILKIKSDSFRQTLTDIFNNCDIVINGKVPRIGPDERPERGNQGQIPFGFENQEDQPEEKEEGPAAEVSEEIRLPEPREEESKPVGPPQKPVKQEPADPVPYEEIKEMFNAICISFPPVKIMGKQRKVMIAARWKEYGGNLDMFRNVFVKMEQSDFLTGRNGKNWRASFDWAILPNNFIKILEGNYVNVNSSSGGGWGVIRSEAMGGQG